MGSNYTKIFYRDYEKLQKEHEKALEKQRTQDAEIRRWQRLYELERKENERLAKEKEELEAKTEALKREVARLNGILNMDGNNSGTPTSRTALHKTVHVMHDHNMVNYNKDYSFTNVECVQHLLRDLQKVTDNLSRLWSGRLKEHIQHAIHDRNQLLQQDKNAFPDEYVLAFFDTFNQIMIQANLEHNENPAQYYYKEEAALLLRVMEYKNNYFAWVTCFDLPVTNNLSERSLRGSKTHMKVSGQFLSEEYAIYYAAIQSYIQTARRNGINEMSALIRLCDGNPFSLSDILAFPSRGCE